MLEILLLLYQRWCLLVIISAIALIRFNLLSPILTFVCLRFLIHHHHYQYQFINTILVEDEEQHCRDFVRFSSVDVVPFSSSRTIFLVFALVSPRWISYLVPPRPISYPPSSSSAHLIVPCFYCYCNPPPRQFRVAVPSTSASFDIVAFDRLRPRALVHFHLIVACCRHPSSSSPHAFVHHSSSSFH